MSRRRSLRRRLEQVALVAGVIGCALMAATAGYGAPPDIEAKRAEAEAVLAELREMDHELELAVEAYNGAAVRLDEIEEELDAARRHLEIARRSHREAQARLSERIVALYVNGSDASALEIILGAGSLDDLLDRLDAAERVSAQDARIIEEIVKARTTIAKEARRLERARAEQRGLVAARAARREEIEQGIADRQAYYTSVKDQIAGLVAEEEERQRRLAEEAERRREEQRQIAVAAAAAGVDTTIVSTPATPADSLPEIPIPEGIGTAPPSRLGEQAVPIALQYLGIPYVWGGASPGQGFDCSGLTMYVYAQLGVSLPHYAASQYGMGVPVSRDQLQPGDLVFFRGLGHMGMYIGGGNFIHAPHTGDVVKISSLSDSYYVANWVGARRVA